jgi:hypothetical protein
VSTIESQGWDADSSEDHQPRAKLIKEKKSSLKQCKGYEKKIRRVVEEKASLI